ncbi:MAG: hypothetical protein ACREX5_21290 [Achromobacter pestifer]
MASTFMRSIVVGIALLGSGSAFSQYAPDATMDLGTSYGQLALGQTVLDGTRSLDKKSRAQPQPPAGNAGRASRLEMEAMWRRIEPEYLRRVQADGRVKADAWLAAQARTLGEQAGRAARQR